jgi:hypothetical protein
LSLARREVRKSRISLRVSTLARLNLDPWTSGAG